MIKIGSNQAFEKEQMKLVNTGQLLFLNITVKGAHVKYLFLTHLILNVFNEGSLV